MAWDTLKARARPLTARGWESPQKPAPERRAALLAVLRCAGCHPIRPSVPPTEGATDKAIVAVLVSGWLAQVGSGGASLGRCAGRGGRPRGIVVDRLTVQRSGSTASESMQRSTSRLSPVNTTRFAQFMPRLRCCRAPGAGAARGSVLGDHRYRHRRARFAAELSYALAAPGGRGVVTPFAGLTLAGGDAGSVRVGGRRRLDPDVAVSLEATRREGVEAVPEFGLTLRGSLRW